MALVAIRGATTINNNSKEEIKAACTQLADAVVNRNNLNPQKDIVMIFLTMTDDITAYNAAAAIRNGMNWHDLPFFTSQEPSIDNMLPRCIRLLVQCNIEGLSQKNVSHVYLNEATKLRPDLSQK